MVLCILQFKQWKWNKLTKIFSSAWLKIEVWRLDNLLWSTPFSASRPSWSFAIRFERQVLKWNPDYSRTFWEIHVGIIANMKDHSSIGHALNWGVLKRSIPKTLAFNAKMVFFGMVWRYPDLRAHPIALLVFKKQKSRLIIFVAITLGTVSPSISGIPAFLRCLVASSSALSCSGSTISTSELLSSPVSSPGLELLWSMSIPMDRVEAHWIRKKHFCRNNRFGIVCTDPLFWIMSIS